MAPLHTDFPPGRLAHHLTAFAAVLAGVGRAHWQMENSLHWRLDVLMGEDACRARSGEAAANLAVLRKITLNTLKLYPPLPGKKGQAMSIRSRQYPASIQPNYLASLFKNPALSDLMRLPCPRCHDAPRTLTPPRRRYRQRP